MPTSRRERPMRVGVISDTHGQLRPEAVAALEGSQRILHAGDIGSPDVLAALERIAPVTAVAGNMDRDHWSSFLPSLAVVEIAGVRIGVTHDRAGLLLDPRDEGLKVLVSGHTHRPSSERIDGVLFFNPGSAGPRRCGLPVAVGRLELTRGRVKAKILRLRVG